MYDIICKRLFLKAMLAFLETLFPCIVQASHYVLNSRDPATSAFQVARGNRHESLCLE